MLRTPESRKRVVDIELGRTVVPRAAACPARLKLAAAALSIKSVFLTDFERRETGFSAPLREWLAGKGGTSAGGGGDCAGTEHLTMGQAS